MITLISRKEIIHTKPIIASEIIKLQNAFYDEQTLMYYQESDEAEWYLEQFDCVNEKTSHYITFNKVISLGYSDIKTYTNALTAKLIELFNYLKTQELVVISHLKLDFFGNRGNSYPPLRQAYKKLEKIVDKTTYKEALIIDVSNLGSFVEILFWITRCDPSVAEYIFLFDKQERFQFYLCKYGNIHLTEFNKEELTNEKLENLGWLVIDGEEFDNFTDEEDITGRQMIV